MGGTSKVGHRRGETHETDPEPGAGLSDRLVGWVLTIGGLVGALAAFVLIIEKMALLKNLAYVPSCSINPVCPAAPS